MVKRLKEIDQSHFGKRIYVKKEMTEGLLYCSADKPEVVKEDSCFLHEDLFKTMCELKNSFHTTKSDFSLTFEEDVQKRRTIGALSHLLDKPSLMCGAPFGFLYLHAKSSYMPSTSVERNFFKVIKIIGDKTFWFDLWQKSCDGFKEQKQYLDLYINQPVDAEYISAMLQYQQQPFFHANKFFFRTLVYHDPLLIMNELLQTPGVFVGIKNELGQSALERAALAGHYLSLSCLIQNSQVDPNARNSQNQQTALVAAACHGYDWCVSILLKHPLTDANLKVNGLTALHYAVKNKDIAVVCALMQCRHLYVNSQERVTGFTPLHLAAMNNDVLSVNVLLRHPRIDPNSKAYDGNTALHWAVRKNAIASVAALVKNKKIDKNSLSDNDGYSALHLAVMANHPQCLRLLLTSKASCVNQRSRIDCLSPLQLAFKQQDNSCLRELLCCDRVSVWYDI